MPAPLRVKAAYAETPAVAVLDGPEMVVGGWLSAPVVDNSREFIDGRDIDLADYRKNPVLLWSHNRTTYTLGHARVVEPREYKGTGLYGVWCEFAFDRNDPEAVKVYHKFRDGHLRAFSVGFVPYGWRDMTAAELKQAGAAPGTRAKRMTRGKLLEASVVTVPDNQDALAEYVKSAPAADFLSAAGRFPRAAGHSTHSHTGDRPMSQAAETEATGKAAGDPAAKAMSATDDTAGGSAVAAGKPGQMACKAMLKGCVGGYREATAHAANSDDDKLPGKLKGWAKKVGKACKKAHAYASEKYPDDEEIKALAADLDEMDSDGDGDPDATDSDDDDDGTPDAADAADKNPDEKAAADVAAKVDGLNAGLALLTDALREKHDGLDAANKATADELAAVKAWQAKAEEAIGGIAVALNTLNGNVTLLLNKR